LYIINTVHLGNAVTAGAPPVTPVTAVTAKVRVLFDWLNPVLWS